MIDDSVNAFARAEVCPDDLGIHLRAAGRAQCELGVGIAGTPPIRINVDPRIRIPIQVLVEADRAGRVPIPRINADE